MQQEAPMRWWLEMPQSLLQAQAVSQVVPRARRLWGWPPMLSRVLHEGTLLIHFYEHDV